MILTYSSKILWLFPDWFSWNRLIHVCLLRLGFKLSSSSDWSTRQTSTYWSSVHSCHWRVQFKRQGRTEKWRWAKKSLVVLFYPVKFSTWLVGSGLNLNKTARPTEHGAISSEIQRQNRALNRAQRRFSTRRKIISHWTKKKTARMLPTGGMEAVIRVRSNWNESCPATKDYNRVARAVPATTGHL